MQPLAVFIGFSAFIVYSTWAALQGTDLTHTYFWFGGGGANYLSPFYSPALFGSNDHPGYFGSQPSWWPAWAIFSPAFFIMWIPAGFRFTCYYYRGAYYKAFWLDPVACAVGEPRKTYWGEKYLPLILQNGHRYFLYLALVFIFILGRDAIDGFFFKGADGAEHFGLAVGSLVLLINVILLSAYTLGCHSLRHLVGGFLDSFTKSSPCHSCYKRGELPQPQAHDVGLVQPRLGGLHRCLHSHVRHGHLDGFPILLRKYFHGYSLRNF